jgi:hypothetical protein
MKTLTMKEFALAARLRDAGIPLEDCFVKASVPPKLLLAQAGNPLDSTVIELDSGTGYVIEVSLGCDLSEMAVSGWMLELPWEDLQLRWLEDPREMRPTEDYYHLPGEGPHGHDRDAVMNHRRQFRRGDFIEARLLAHSFEPIPDCYRHGSSVEAKLTLFDHVQQETSATVSLWVDKSVRFSQRPKRLRTRPRLFDHPDQPKTSEKVKVERNRRKQTGSLAHGRRHSPRVDRLRFETRWRRLA